MLQRDLGTGTTENQNPAQISETHSSLTNLTECGQYAQNMALP